jgi:hypothetical protein
MDWTLIKAAFLELIGFRTEQDLNFNQNSGILTIGQTYEITNFIAGDDFTNVGAGANVTGEIFIATGATPTTWTNLSVLNNNSLLESLSGFYVNDIPGVDLISVEKAIALNPTTLIKTESIAEYLARIYETETKVLINKFIQKAKTILGTKELLYNSDLSKNYEYSEKDQDGSFNGYLIQMNESYSIKGIIENIQIQLKESDSFRIYLYKLTQKAPIKTFDFSYTTGFNKQIEAVTDWILEYMNSEESNLTYLIGFYEYDSSNPQSVQLSETNKLFQYNTENYYCEYFQYEFIKINNDNLNWNGSEYDLPADIDSFNCILQPATMNLRMKVNIDSTDIIIDNKINFAEALQYQIGKRIVTDALNTKNFNGVTESQNDWENLAMFFEQKLNGYNLTNTNGLNIPIIGLINQIVYDFEKLDEGLFKQQAFTKMIG